MSSKFFYSFLLFKKERSMKLILYIVICFWILQISCAILKNETNAVYRHFDQEVDKKITKNRKIYFKYNEEGLRELLTMLYNDGIKVIDIDTVRGVDTTYYIEVEE